MSNVSISPENLSPEAKRALLAKLLEKKAQQEALQKTVKQEASSQTPSPEEPHKGTEPRLNTPLPLSYGQRALWFLYQSDRTNTAYNVSIPARIRSTVNVNALKQAFQDLGDHHPTLRTTFTVNTGSTDEAEPCQTIHSTLPVSFKQVDSTGWSEEAAWSEEALHEAVTATHHEPFDLENGPIYRVTLFTRSPKEHVLLFSLHHIVYDAWSIGPLLNDAAQLYAAANAETIPNLPPLTHQYDDYVQWQKQTLEGPEGDRLLAYWQQQLAGDLPTLDLPTDQPRPLQPSGQGASHTFSFKPEQLKALRIFARSEGMTLYTVLMATFQSLLYRYTGQTDILVGSPVGGRPQKSFEQIVGYFVNPVTIRGSLSNTLTFKEFLSQIRTTTLDAIDHQAYPFSLLVEQLQPKRDPSRSPIFQVLFNFLKLQQIESVASILVPSESSTSPKPTVQWANLELEAFELEQQEGQFDLTLEMFEAEDSLLGVFQYSTDLFNPDTIKRMAGHFQTLLEAAIAAPNQQISNLPLLTSSEQSQFSQWNTTSLTYQSIDKTTDDLSLDCIHQRVEQQAAKTPTKAAVVCGDQQLTYQELNERANQLARHLQSKGVKPDDLIGLCIERSLEMLVGVLGILKASGAYVPLDPSYPPSRLDHMLTDSGAQIALTQNSLCDLLKGDASRSNNLSTICLDTDWAVIAEHDKQNLDIDISTSNLAYVIYTSGSTGKPKGVMIQHDSLVNFTQAAIEGYGFLESDRTLQFASISFDAAAEEIYPCLTTGGTLVLRNQEMLGSVAQFLQTCEDWQLTVLDLPTAYWQKITLELAASDLSLPAALRFIIIGGERVSPEQVRTWQTHVGDTPRLLNTYGPTEATVVATAYTITSAAKIPGEVPIGKPLNQVTTHILDKQLQPVPIGIPGELHLGGLGLARGYLNRPKMTAERFIPKPLGSNSSSHDSTNDDAKQPAISDRLYKTGDLVRYLPDGNIEYLGRIDHQVKIRGFRIELGEIETALSQHLAVTQVVVIDREDTPGDKRLVAYLIADTATDVSPSAFRQFLQQSLPEYMVPAAFVSVKALPITPNGKVDRRALPKPQASDLASATTYVAPRNPVEKQLTTIWETLLNVKPIGINDNFFDLGGHSLLTIGLSVQIEQHFSKKLPLSTVITAPTIAQLAVTIDPSLATQTDNLETTPVESTHLAPTSLNSAPSNSIVLLREGKATPNHQTQQTTKPPLFLLHDADGEILLYRSLAQALDPAITVYGIQPYSMANFPILHTRVTDMVSFYVEQIRTVQPEGPYFLGGLCVGGTLAFEVAHQLKQQGHAIAMVALLDSPDLDASERTSTVTAQRLKNLSGVFSDSGDSQQKLHQKLAGIVGTVSKKALNVVTYESQKKIGSVRDQAQLTLLRRHLDNGTTLPHFLQNISVRTVLTWAPCIQGMPKEIFDGSVTLFRATQASDIFEGTDIDDSPMRDLFEDDLLGWGKRVSQGVQVHDIPGGHSSMLQAPNVDVIAKKIQTIYQEQLQDTQQETAQSVA
ncbi:MAG: amino acid adenylation domain-containing protein [Cyanobacteria bacterium P01_F01_bin.53]